MRNDTVLVGNDWILVESDRRARVTLVPARDVWLTYYSSDRTPPQRTLSIKLPAQSRSSFAPRSAKEGIWLRADDGGSIAVAVDRDELRLG
jgi:hypothetical protein